MNRLVAVLGFLALIGFSVYIAHMVTKEPALPDHLKPITDRGELHEALRQGLDLALAEVIDPPPTDREYASACRELDAREFEFNSALWRPSRVAVVAERIHLTMERAQALQAERGVKRRYTTRMFCEDEAKS